MFHLFIISSDNIHCSINFWNNQGSQSGTKIILIWQKKCFQPGHHHNKTCSHNILFPLYDLFSFWISIVWSHKLYFLKNSKIITVKKVISGLYLIKPIQCFWCLHNNTKNCTDNILLELFYLYFNFFIHFCFKFQLFKNKNFIVWNFWERSKQAIATETKQDTNAHVWTQTKVRDKQGKIVLVFYLLNFVNDILCPCNPIV